MCLGVCLGLCLGLCLGGPDVIVNEMLHVPIYDVNVAAMEYYGPKNFVLTIVGDYSEVSKQIKLLDDLPRLN